MLICDNTSPIYNLSSYADLSIYYNVGKAMVNGKVLYKDIFDLKGPYIFFIGALSYKIFRNVTLFFIFNLISFLLYVYSNYKIFCLRFSKEKSFILSILSFSILFLITYLGNPEGMFIGIFSYFIYWILSNGFGKDNKLRFLLFGAFFSFIFFTKINVLLPFAIIALIYIIYLAKEKKLKKLTIEISLFLTSSIIFSLPIFVYEKVNNLETFYILETYLGTSSQYNSSLDLNVFAYLIFRIFIISLLFIVSFVYLILREENKITKRNLAICFIYFIGTILSIAITLKFYKYYYYIVYSFVTIVFLFIFNKKTFNLFQKVIGVISFIFIIASIILHFNCNSVVTKNSNYYNLANDYKEKFESKKVFAISSIDEASIFNLFDNQPFNKHFVAINLDYELIPEFKEFKSSIGSGGVDYLIVTYVTYDGEDYPYINEFLNFDSKDLCFDKKQLGNKKDIDDAKYYNQLTTFLSEKFDEENSYKDMPIQTTNYFTIFGSHLNKVDMNIKVYKYKF